MSEKHFVVSFEKNGAILAREPVYAQCETDVVALAADRHRDMSSVGEEVSIWVIEVANAN